MFCEKCGNQMDDNAKVCPNCGEKVNNDLNSNPYSNVITVGGEEPKADAPTPAEVEKKVKTLSIVGIACGVVGFIFGLITPLLAFPFAVAGIICSILALKDANANGINKTLPIAGLIAAIAGPVIAFIVSFIIGLIIGFIAALA